MWVKNEKELEQLRENAKIHKEVFEEIKKMVKPWVTGYDVDKLCWEIASKYNVLCWFKWVYKFPANICISLNDCVVHGIPSRRMEYEKWDVVKFDIWIKTPFSQLICLSHLIQYPCLFNL